MIYHTRGEYASHYIATMITAASNIPKLREAINRAIIKEPVHAWSSSETKI
jgi:hypothetical protein